MKTKHTITFTVEDNGVENLKFDEKWNNQPAFFKWDYLNDLVVILSGEYQNEGRNFEKETKNARHK